MNPRSTDSKTDALKSNHYTIAPVRCSMVAHFALARPSAFAALLSLRSVGQMDLPALKRRVLEVGFSCSSPGTRVYPFTTPERIAVSGC